VWHLKEPSLLKAINAKHRSEICSPVTGNGNTHQILTEKLLVRLILNNQTNTSKCRALGEETITTYFYLLWFDYGQSGALTRYSWTIVLQLSHRTWLIHDVNFILLYFKIFMSHFLIDCNIFMLPYRKTWVYTCTFWAVRLSLKSLTFVISLEW
jgi:hypothetical protein